MRMIPIQLAPGGPWYGIDTVHPIDRDTAYRLRHEMHVTDAHGDEHPIAWVARYAPIDGVPLDVPDPNGGDHRGCWTLSRSELDGLLEAGLAVLPIQWGPSGADRLTARLGHQRGGALRAWARAVGLPPGVHLGLDVEGRRAQVAGVAGCTAYIEAGAYSTRTGDTYRSLLYTSGTPLDGAALYGLGGVDCYWSAATRPGQPLPRGAAIEQDPPGEIAGVPCDLDTAQADRWGDGPVMVGTEHARELLWQDYQLRGSRWYARSLRV